MFSYSIEYYVLPPVDQYLKFKNRCSLMGIFMHDFDAYLHRGIRCKHRVTECQAFSPVVRIGFPHPPAQVLPPPHLWFQWGGGRIHSLGGEGAGGASSEEGIDTLVFYRDRTVVYNPSTVVNKIFYLLSDSIKRNLLVRYR